MLIIVMSSLDKLWREREASRAERMPAAPAITKNKTELSCCYNYNYKTEVLGPARLAGQKAEGGAEQGGGSRLSVGPVEGEAQQEEEDGDEEEDTVN